MNSASTNRVIVITGATGALGSKAAHAFAAGGHSLVLLDRNQDRLDALSRDLNLPEERLFTSVVDLRDADAVRSTAEVVSVKFGGANALIQLVGGWVGGKTLVEADPEDLESMLAQHVWTTFYLFQSFAPQLSKNGWGRVIVVSKSTVPNPPGKEGPYAAAKAAQENLVLNLSAELRENGVTANIIQVKSIDIANKGTGTSPDEIVAAMLYLFSDEASKLSGARIPLY
jgi:NAD(P)-dependent dehydrogenase (short-subunit alcohol dehydrogenase family)